MPPPNQERYTSAKLGLAQLLELGRPPKILEVLRALEEDILRCHRNGVPQSQILNVLNEAGFHISRTGFSYAYRILLYEKGLLKSTHQAPTAPDPRTARPIPPRITRAVVPAAPQATPPPASTTTNQQPRSSIRDLLNKGL